MHKLYDLPWTDTLNRTKNVVTSLAINCDEKWRIIILLNSSPFFIQLEYGCGFLCIQTTSALRWRLSGKAVEFSAWERKEVGV